MPRPQLNPSNEQRRQVKSMAALGTRHQDIATIMGIRSPKTLRKYFRDELDRGAVEADNNVALTLYQMATSGEHVAATIFWLKCRGWKDRVFLEPAVSVPPAFIVAPEAGTPPVLGRPS